jgi:hypothetical protein
MNGIQVVIFLVRCSESLLLCEDLPSEHLMFSSMGVCHASVSSVVEEARASSEDGVVVFAKCQYLLAGPLKVRSANARQTAGVR